MVSSSDKQKIRNLMMSDDVSNHNLAIELAINTLKMSVDDIVELFGIRHLIIRGGVLIFPIYELKVLGRLHSYYTASACLSNAKMDIKERILNYLYDVDNENI